MAGKKKAGSTDADALERLREICSSFPEVTEKLAWGEPTFRVRDKMFAMLDNHHHGAEHFSVWCNAPLGFQEILIGAKPERFFKPPYMGPKGWVGVILDGDVDWNEVTEVLREAYRMTAPKALLPRGEAKPVAAAPAAKRKILGTSRPRTANRKGRSVSG